MRVDRTMLGLGMILLFLVLAFHAHSFSPSAPTSITNVSMGSPTPSVGYMLNNSGGTIVTLTINATTQNYRWKGYVGNISGTLALLDASNNSLFSWPVTNTVGEVYATRSPGSIRWDNIGCVDNYRLQEEQRALNITNSSVDSIENTFSNYTHSGFYTGFLQVNANLCRTVKLNVNNSNQGTYFQEVLLSDGDNMVYAALIENSIAGYNNQSYDFQMIVAENALEEIQPSVAYYFYVELI